MRALLSFAAVAVFFVATSARADVELFDGETVTGDVSKTTGSRIFVRTPASGVRSYHKRDVRSATNGDGEPVGCLIELTDAPLTDAQKARLGQVADFAAVRVDPVVSKLLDDPSTACFEELKRLARDPRAKNRPAAMAMLAHVGAPEAVRELALLAVEEKDPKIRFAAANELMRSNSIRCVESEGLLETLKTGFADKKSNVRFCLAYVVGKLGDTAAIPILEQQLKNSDHHFRESAALALAELGNARGLRELLKMVKREGSDRERIAVCKALGGLRAKSALSALKTVARSKNAEVAAAAARAIEQINAGDEEDRTDEGDGR